MTAGKTTPKKKEPVKRKLTQAQLETILTKFEKPIRSQPFETAFALDEYGKELFRKDGSSAEVKLHGMDMRNCRVLTHNHPTGGSFSSADISTAIHNNVQEVRCFGTEYQYSLRPGKSGWGITPARAAQEWGEIQMDLLPKYQALFNEKCQKIGETAARREIALHHSHELMQILAKRHNFIYRRNKW
jgi:hypothetical protein